MKITHELLRKCGACADGLDQFDIEFPNGVEFTVANVMANERSAKNNFHFLSQCLPQKYLQKFEDKRLGMGEHWVGTIAQCPRCALEWSTFLLIVEEMENGQ